MGFYIHCPKCGEETLDDGTLTCSNCKWYEGKDQEDQITVLRAQLAAKDDECETLRERISAQKELIKTTPSAALAAIAKGIGAPMACGHGLDCWDDSVKGEERCMWCAAVDAESEVNRFKDILRSVHAKLNDLGAKPYDARIFNADVLWQRIAALRARDEGRECERLRVFVADVANWREWCHEYDEDMDNPARDFDDEEEWALIEEHAKGVLEETKRTKA
jgi:uncharacterized Zn finger protein (UPF0148 family)